MNSDHVFYAVMGFVCGVVIALTPFYLADLTMGQRYHRCRLANTVEYCVEAITLER